MDDLGYTEACQGEYYQNIKDYDNMKIYYTKAIKKDVIWAMINMGWHYQFVEHNYKLMKKYYNMAISDKDQQENDNCLPVFDHLIEYYTNIEKNHHLVKKYELQKELMQKIEL